MKKLTSTIVIPTLLISSFTAGYQVANFKINKQNEEDMLMARLNSGLWLEDYESTFITPELEKAIAKEKATLAIYETFSKKVPGKKMYEFVKEALKKQKAEYGSTGCIDKIDPLLIACIIYRESRFNPSTVSSSGALGLTQVMPLHLKNLKAAGIVDNVNKKELLEWQKNIRAGIFVLLSYAKATDDITKALMMYNAGPKRPHFGAKYARRILRDYQEVEEQWK